MLQYLGIVIIFAGVVSLTAKSEYRLKNEMEDKRKQLKIEGKKEIN